jgi:hypothetical protein
LRLKTEAKLHGKRNYMSKAIRPEHLKQLRPLETELKQAVKLQEPEAAEPAITPELVAKHNLTPAAGRSLVALRKFGMLSP